MHERLERQTKKVYEVALRNQHRLGLASFLAGFAFDILTLHRIDRLYEQASFGVYMLVGTVLLVWVSLRERGTGHKLSEEAAEKEVSQSTAMLTFLQFVYGALAGGFLVLYGRSGTVEGSSFFLSGLVLLLLGNEIFRARYKKVLFRFTVWFVLLCAYATLVLPLVYGRLGFDVFTHGLITASMLGFAMLLLFRMLQVLVRPADFYLGCIGTALVLGLFWVSYYSHSIPPVPLSLQSALMAHEVVHEGDVYRVTYEKNTNPFTSWVRESSDQFVTQINNDGERLYCFSQIYAPATLSSPLQHRWQVLDEATNTWQPIATIPFSITGGRRDGYRAYSYITLRGEDVDGSYGKYTCNIETEEGFLIGRRMVEVVWGQAATTMAEY